MECPQCGNPVPEDDKPCPFCQYATSIGIPEELVADADSTKGGVNYDFAILNGFIDNKFMLAKAGEQGFVPEMLEILPAQKMARAIQTLYESEPKNESWDKLLVRTKLKANGHLTVALDQFYAKVVEVPIPTLEQLMSYVGLVKNRYALRQIKEVGEESFRFSSWDHTPSREEIDEFVARSIDKLHAIQRLSVNKRINLVRQEMDEILADFEFREQHGDRDIIGYSLKPFNILNDTLSGLRKGFLYGMAGAPRRGKTNLVLDIATYCARENRIPILFFTFEQTKKNLTYRLLSKESYLNPGTLQRKRILNDPIKKAKLADGLKKMSQYQDYLFIIESTKEETIDRIRGHAYNVMSEFDTSDVVIFIDYIQKMPLARNYDNEKFKVEEISTSLKQLAIELNCPIVAISSLSKEGCIIDATPGTERPTMLHCKGSGDIEYDLDVAMILAKDWGDTNELYEQLKHKAEAMGKDALRLPKIDIINVYIDKNRDAPEGSMNVIQFFFFIEENKYTELGYKLPQDTYRFKKIENLINILLERGFIQFHSHEERGRGTQFDEASTKAPSPTTDTQKQKIRLRY